MTQAWTLGARDTHIVHFYLAVLQEAMFLSNMIYEKGSLQGGNFMSWILVEKKRVYVTHVHGRHSKHVTTADSASFQQFILSFSYVLFQPRNKAKILRGVVL